MSSRLVGSMVKTTGLECASGRPGGLFGLTILALTRLDHRSLTRERSEAPLPPHPDHREVSLPRVPGELSPSCWLVDDSVADWAYGRLPLAVTATRPGWRMTRPAVVGIQRMERTLEGRSSLPTAPNEKGGERPIERPLDQRFDQANLAPIVNLTAAVRPVSGTSTQGTTYP